MVNDVTLYQGDCLDIMRALPDGCVDAVITDPPFGINFQYNLHVDTPDNYGSWIWEVIEQAEKTLKPGSPVFVWQAMLNVRYFSKWFPRNWRIFAACKNFVQMRPTPMNYSYDPVLVWWTDGKPYSLGTATRDWHIGNTANTLNRKDGEAFSHPCARPIDQMRHIVEQWVRPNGIVLDPFMGSGTTGVACVQTGRRFVGIEIDPEYYAIAEKRIKEAQLQPRLPMPEEQPNHKQVELFATP